MSIKLCIAWMVNGRRGYSSPQDDTPESRLSLEKLMVEFKKTWPGGEFSIIHPTEGALPTNHPKPVGGWVRSPAGQS